MTAAAPSYSRRGACPGLSTPMPTGDGLLARLMPTGTMTLDAMAGLCAAARRYGNGTIEITSRGSIQVRGLTRRHGAVRRMRWPSSASPQTTACRSLPIRSPASTAPS